MAIQRLDGVQWNDNKGEQIPLEKQETFVNSSFGDGYANVDIPQPDGQHEITMVPSDSENEGVVITGHRPSAGEKIIKETLNGLIPGYSDFRMLIRFRKAYNQMVKSHAQKTEDLIIKTKPVLDKFGKVQGYQQDNYDRNKPKRLLETKVLNNKKQMTGQTIYTYDEESGKCIKRSVSKFDPNLGKGTYFADYDQNNNLVSYEEIEYDNTTGLKKSHHSVDNEKEIDRTIEYNYVLYDENIEDDFYDECEIDTDINGNTYWLIDKNAVRK